MVKVPLTRVSRVPPGAGTDSGRPSMAPARKAPLATAGLLQAEAGSAQFSDDYGLVPRTGAAAISGTRLATSGSKPSIKSSVPWCSLRPERLIASDRAGAEELETRLDGRAYSAGCPALSRRTPRHRATPESGHNKAANIRGGSGQRAFQAPPASCADHGRGARLCSGYPQTIVVVE